MLFFHHDTKWQLYQNRQCICCFPGLRGKPDTLSQLGAMFSGLRQMSDQAQRPGVSRQAKLISRVITRLNRVNKASVHYRFIKPKENNNHSITNKKADISVHSLDIARIIQIKKWSSVDVCYNIWAYFRRSLPSRENNKISRIYVYLIFLFFPLQYLALNAIRPWCMSTVWRVVSFLLQFISKLFLCPDKRKGCQFMAGLISLSAVFLVLHS